MTLHGHTRIELTDVHTGAVEVVESDNLITNAVSDIFNGYGGSLNKAACCCTTRRWAATRPQCLPRRARALWARRWPGRSTRPKTRCAAAPT